MTMTESIQSSASIKIKGLTQKSEKTLHVRNDVNKIIAKFQLFSTKTVGVDRFLESKFKILK